MVPIIGVDFDNTIVCYDALFHRLAVEQGLVPADLPPDKGSVRDYLRSIDKESLWTELQGYVYGVRMRDAPLFPGVCEFFLRFKQQGILVVIISHKTRYPYQGPRYDLHQEAHDWLESQGFYDPSGFGLPRNQVYFELTKQAKLARIRDVGCTHFIDDLPELLAEPDFPSGVTRILFDPVGHTAVVAGVLHAASWHEADRLILL